MIYTDTRQQIENVETDLERHICFVQQTDHAEKYLGRHVFAFSTE